MIGRRLALAGLFLAVAGPAFAHPGHGPDAGFLAGFSHPFGGLDHLLAMLAVGLWAGLVSPKAWAIWPVTFVVFMLAGFGLGAAGGPVPAAEIVIAASLVALGSAVLLKLKPSTAAGAVVIAVFALAHGYVHGQELPAHATGLSFAAGLGLATALLHMVGLTLAWSARRWQAESLVRTAGLGVAAAGLALTVLG